MRDSEGAYFYQIITEKDDSVKIAQVQHILEDSFFSADIILTEVNIDLQMVQKVQKSKIKRDLFSQGNAKLMFRTLTPF